MRSALKCLGAGLKVIDHTLEWAYKDSRFTGLDIDFVNTLAHDTTCIELVIAVKGDAVDAEKVEALHQILHWVRVFGAVLASSRPVVFPSSRRLQELKTIIR